MNIFSSIKGPNSISNSLSIPYIQSCFTSVYLELLMWTPKHLKKIIPLTLDWLVINIVSRVSFIYDNPSFTFGKINIRCIIVTENCTFNPISTDIRSLD